MPRTRKVMISLYSDEEEREWIASTVERPKIEERHPNPGTAISNLSAELRQQFGEEVELEYELKLPRSLEAKLEALRNMERELAALSEQVKAARYEFAMGCLDRRIKQQDIAELMSLSQSYINTVIRTKGQISRGGTGDRLLSRRRKTDL